MIDKTIVLEGYGIRLEPLHARHMAELREACDDPALWEHTFSASPFGSDESASAWLASMRDNPRYLTFAVIDAASGSAIGSTSFLDVEPAHRKLEIGWTFLASRYWRTHVNTACKRLLMGYAFEDWGAIRVQFKAEAKNARSRRAIERIGATFEGVFRNFRIKADGEIRDTSFYSVIDSEWPAVRARLAGQLNAGSTAKEHA